jgi:hypothetical protein
LRFIRRDSRPQGVWQRTGNNVNCCAYTDCIEDSEHIRRFHPDTTKTGRAPDIPFFGSAMNVNASGKCISISRFETFEPDYPGYNRVTARSVRYQDFTGTAPVFEDRAERCTAANLFRYLHFPQRRCPAARVVSQAELGGRDRITAE